MHLSNLPKSYEASVPIFNVKVTSLLSFCPNSEVPLYVYVHTRTRTHTYTLTHARTHAHTHSHTQCILTRFTEIDCGTPPSVSNAHTENLTATTFMATAQYVCDEGYKVDVIGAPLVCGKSASWLGDPLVCSGRCLFSKTYFIPLTLLHNEEALWYEWPIILSQSKTITF